MFPVHFFSFISRETSSYVLFMLCKETRKNRDVVTIFSIKTCMKTWDFLAHSINSDRQKSGLQMFFLSLNTSAIICVRIFSTSHHTWLAARNSVWCDTAGRERCSVFWVPEAVPVPSSQVHTSPGGTL